MLKALITVRLASLRSGLLGLSRRKTTPSRGKILLFSLLMLYVAVSFAFIFYGYFSMLSSPFYDAGLSWLYFALFVLTDFALMFIGSIFTAKTQLFEAKDNDLLLSMPLPPSYILASRMITLLIINYAFNLVIAIPVAVAWCVKCPISAAGAFSFIIIALLLPFFALAFSALFAWLLSLLTQRIRNKSLMTIIFSFAFLGIYFWFMNKANTAVMALAADGTAVASKLSPVFLLRWMGNAVADGNLTQLLFSALCLVVPFLLAYRILTVTFIKTVSTKHGFDKIKYTEGKQKVSGAFSALYRRELGRFLSSPAYVMNAGLGAVFLAAGGIAVPFFGGTILSAFATIPELKSFICPALILCACMMSGMATITAASVSIEGNTIWISQSLPVSTDDILKSKLLLHLSIMCPATIIAEIGIIITARPSLTEVLASILLPLVFTVFSALAGLIANLLHYNLDWVNETQAVKNGFAVIITLFLSWGGVLAIGIGSYLLSEFVQIGVILLIISALLILICRIMYSWILKKGTKLYRAMQG